MHVSTMTLQMTFASESFLAKPAFELLFLSTFVLEMFIQASLMFINIATLRATVTRIRDDECGLLLT